MAERVNLVLEDGTGDMMSELAKGERRRGAWLSHLVKAIYEQEIGMMAESDIEQLRLSFLGMVGEQKRLEARLLRVERQLAAIIADSAND